MIILKIIHGYPLRYNAGSEVYSQLLCNELAERGHKVFVFTREENLFKDDYAILREVDSQNPKISMHVINMPRIRMSHQYRHAELDNKFASLIEEIKPDIVHIGHLSHLSTSIVDVINQKNIPIIFTLHDYWLICSRGQFIQKNSKIPWAICDKQEDSKCAIKCFSGFFSGDIKDKELDTKYWTNWVSQRTTHLKNLASKINIFIAPSHYLLSRFRDEFGISEDKLFYLDYGFNLQSLRNRSRIPEKLFTFGYIGTHIPTKGIQDLIIAFSQLKNKCFLRIWGRPREETASLKLIVSSLALEIQERIEWRPEYKNNEIVAEVFNHVDALVVPSIWVENSPLVIHEALQARVPVITADVGGMAEYVKHNQNGLLFKHRNYQSLIEQMDILSSNPRYAEELGAKGYLQSKTGDIPSINEHVNIVEQIYYNLLNRKTKKSYEQSGTLENYL